jgi:hypothetical protein
MQFKVAAQWSPQDLEDLVVNGTKEGRYLEYKQELPSNSSGEKKEFLADIVAASETGCTLLYGVTEKRDDLGRPSGVAEKVVGVSGNIDLEIRRLEQMIRSGIEPNIPRIDIRSIGEFENGPVVAISLTQSWMRPHMVTFEGSSKFFTRTNAGKAPMDYPEIRAAFLGSEAGGQRIARFRAERINQILSGTGSFELRGEATIVLHVVPVAQFLSGKPLEMKTLKEAGQSIPPPGASSFNHFVNMDGFVNVNVLSRSEKELVTSYIQFFRSGAVEVVDAYSLDTDKQFWSPRTESEIGSFFRRACRFFREADLDVPFGAMLTILNVKEYDLSLGHGYFQFAKKPIDRDHLIFPEQFVEEVEEGGMRTLRPTIEMLWNALGEIKCIHYDENGNWKSPND